MGRALVCTSHSAHWHPIGVADAFGEAAMSVAQRKSAARRIKLRYKPPHRGVDASEPVFLKKGQKKARA
jgi:hypothetical protein